MGLKKHQEPLSVGQQIKNLKRLNLFIEDEAAAIRFLNNVSYYRFIKAYSLGLKPKNGSYYDGVTFDQLVELYLFNSDLRQMLFPLIESVEINLRCQVSNYICNTYGVLGYKEPGNFTDVAHHAAFLWDAESETFRNKNAPFVKNFLNNYENGDIPFYALVEILSFGTLSKFYKNMKNPDKKQVASAYGIGYTYLESWIESIAYVRNICAHYGRLYNAKLTKTPKLYRQDIEQGAVNNRIFGVLCCMKHLFTNNERWIEFLDGMEALFGKYPHARACLKNHSRDLHSPLCGEFIPNLVNIARYDS
jgi:abortive infection bacteriophage resistance protein